MALATKYRLKNAKDIERVVRHGRTIKGIFCLIRFLKNDLVNSRCTIIISQKILKRAVDRNKTRRRITEVIQPLMPRLAPCDIMIIVTQSILEKGFDEIKSDLEQNIKKITV